MGTCTVGEQSRVRKRPQRMTQAAVTLSTIVAATAFGIASAAPAAAKSGGPADSESAEPVAVEETTQQSGDKAAGAVEHAQNQVGKPYQYGAAGPDAFDCSGLVQWAYGQVGKDLSRTTYDQINEGTSVNRSDLEPGDLVFFYSGPSHVGMYVGDNKMVHAPRPGRSIEVVNMTNHWDGQYAGARRVA